MQKHDWWALVKSVMNLWVPYNVVNFLTLQITITYLLTPWSRVLLEKLTGFTASQEISRIYGTQKFITIFTSARITISFSKGALFHRVSLLQYIYISFLLA
jgi:hypothetical protein